MSNNKCPETPSAEIRGEWMWAGTVYDAGVGGADRIMARCAESGITDVYLMVKGTGGRLFYLNTKYTDIRSATDRDVLLEAIEAAHAQGIRLHAWVCNLRDSSYRAVHPDAMMIPYLGGGNTSRIDPRNVGYREYMCDVVSEIAAYAIDGLHLDYIRYKTFESGWGDGDFAALAEMGANIGRVRELVETSYGYGGRTADPNYAVDACRRGDPEALLIANHRRESVKRYAKALVDAARSVKPELTVSAALMPEGAYDAAFADINFGQNHSDATELYDYVCPMAYTTDLNMDSSQIKRTAIADAELGNRVVMGLQAYNSAPTATLACEIGMLRRLRRRSEHADRLLGFALFRNATFDYVNLNVESGKIKIKAARAADAACDTIEISAAPGITITAITLGDGFSERATVEIDGACARIVTEGIPTNAELEMAVSYEGEASDGCDPILVGFVGITTLNTNR